MTIFCCKGGKLASIGDPSEQAFIKSNVEILKDSHSSFWIGLYKTHKGMIKKNYLMTNLKSSSNQKCVLILVAFQFSFTEQHLKV